jgi:hypothetical protein
MLNTFFFFFSFHLQNNYEKYGKARQATDDWFDLQVLP